MGPQRDDLQGAAFAQGFMESDSSTLASVFQALVEQKTVSRHLSTKDIVDEGDKWRISQELLTFLFNQ